MKFSGMRWLVVASLIGCGVAGVVSSNVGCGDSDATGSGGSGGGAGGAGGAVVPRYADTFDTDKEMWTLSTYVDANYKNLGAASDPDSGVSLDGGMVPTLEWSGACGDPSPGCLKLTVTFSGFKEYVDPQVNVATPVDFMTGGHNIVRARIRLVSGTFPTGGIQFHVSSGLTAPNSLRLRVGAVRQLVEPGTGDVDADHARHQHRQQQRDPAPRVRSVADRSDRHPVHHGRSSRTACSRWARPCSRSTRSAPDISADMRRARRRRHLLVGVA